MTLLSVQSLFLPVIDGLSAIKRWQYQSLELMKTFSGHRDVVKSLALKGDFLFSASYDGSVKMWTTIIAVELQSFKAFDDSVAVIHDNSKLLLISMTNQLVTYSIVAQRILIITDFGSIILGIIEQDEFIFVAKKSSSSLDIGQIGTSNISDSDTAFSRTIEDSCSAFYSDATRYTFWFALRNGQLLKFILLDQMFNVEEFTLTGSESVVTAVCASESYVAFLNQNNLVTVLNKQTSKILLSFSSNVQVTTAIGCLDDKVLTGGQFGKVFAANINTGQTTELIDQAQAHKRKIVTITSSKFRGAI
jgi:WD40 repeat protein